MFASSSFFDLVQQGGLATWILLLLSVLSLALALVKLYELRQVGGAASERLADQVQAAAARGDFARRCRPGSPRSRPCTTRP